MASKILQRWPVVAALTALVWAGATGRPGAAEPRFVIDLPGGGRLPGEFGRAEAAAEPLKSLPWRAPQFTAPLEFWLDEIVGVRSTVTAAPPADLTGFSCRLRGGDSIDGSIQKIDATEIVLGLPDGGPLTISRDVVTGLRRRTAAAATGYVGPGGLAGWEQAPDSAWRDEAGRIVSDRPNATVSRDVAAPARARYDIVLSWRKPPEFVLAVAAGDGKQVDPFRLELLSTTGKDPMLVLVRHEQAAGMLVPVPLPPGERGRLRLTLFVDQAAGRLAAVVGGEERPVEITVAPAQGRAASPRFRLQVRSGDICLEQIRVAEWRSADPRVGNSDTTQVGFRDCTELEGEIVSLDDAGELVVRTAAGEQTRRLDELESIGFVVADEEAERPAGVAAASVRVVRRGGGVLTGDILAVADDGLVFRRTGLDRAVTVPFADLHSLVSLEAGEPLGQRLGGVAHHLVGSDQVGVEVVEHGTTRAASGVGHQRKEECPAADERLVVRIDALRHARQQFRQQLALASRPLQERVRRGRGWGGGCAVGVRGYACTCGPGGDSHRGLCRPRGEVWRVWVRAVEHASWARDESALLK